MTCSQRIAISPLFPSLESCTCLHSEAAVFFFPERDWSLKQLLPALSAPIPLLSCYSFTVFFLLITCVLLSLAAQSQAPHCFHNIWYLHCLSLYAINSFPSISHPVLLIWLYSLFCPGFWNLEHGYKILTYSQIFFCFFTSADLLVFFASLLCLFPSCTLPSPSLSCVYVLSSCSWS